MRVTLIRHGMTHGNVTSRYIGRTDEPLCESGAVKARILARLGVYPPAQAVYASPLCRTRDTAKIIYPNTKPTLLYDLRECDFGDFENKCFEELKDDASYQKWLDAGGKRAFPNGEEPAAFSERCCGAFQEALDRALERGYQSVSFVVHGGTIMAILERFSGEQRSFYDWHAPNCGGYLGTAEEKSWKTRRVLTVEGALETGSTEAFAL